MTGYSGLSAAATGILPSNWSPSGGPPNHGLATISATGSAYTVTVDLADAAIR